MNKDLFEEKNTLTVKKYGQSGYMVAKTNWFTESIGEIDSYCPKAGKKLRLAMKKLNESLETEEWQSAGILIRDSWIIFVNKICEVKDVDTTDIKGDSVVAKLKKLQIDEKSFNLAKAAFNLSFKTHHDRNIGRHIAMSCAISTISSMRVIIEEEVSPHAHS